MTEDSQPSTKELDAIFRQTPKDVVGEILLFRANQSIARKLQSHGFELSTMHQFFSIFKVRIFGSFVLSCLLDNDDYHDIDMIVDEERLTWKEIEPHVKGSSFKQRKSPDWDWYSFRTTGQHLFGKYLFQKDIKWNRTNASPNTICSHHEKQLSYDSDVHNYHTCYEITNAEKPISLDVTHTKKIDIPITKAAFDIDQIWWDGEFHFPKNFDLTRFVAYPRFTIDSWSNGFHFEQIYSFSFCPVCDNEFGCAPELNSKCEFEVDGKLVCNTYPWYEYYELPNVFAWKKFTLPRVFSLVAKWLNLEELQSIINHSSRNVVKGIKYTPDETLMMDRIATHIRVDEFCSDYRKCKTFLRVLRLMGKGYFCRNLKNFLLD